MDRKARLRKKWADKPEHYKERQHQESGCTDYLQHSADSCPFLQIDKAAFPELTKHENEQIDKARRLGFTTYYPAFPNAQTQALSTLRAAKKFLWEKGRECNQ